jgi:hypothetical protein
MDEKETQTVAPSDVLLEAYRAARETRNLEIQLFWQRSNYFLVLNTALAVGFFSRRDTDGYAIAIASAGIVVGLLWVRINLGSKYWQARWETRLANVEKQLQPGLELFSATWKTIDDDVNRSLDNPRPRGRLERAYRPFDDLYVRAVKAKPSVSRTMTVLAVSFVLFWIVVGAVALF